MFWKPKNVVGRLRDLTLRTDWKYGRSCRSHSNGPGWIDEAIVLVDCRRDLHLPM